MPATTRRDDADDDDREEPDAVGQVGGDRRVTPDAPNTTRNKTIWTMKPDTESIAPADIAAVAGTPKRCRKRTLTATGRGAGIARLM